MRHQLDGSEHLADARVGAAPSVGILPLAATGAESLVPQDNGKGGLDGADLAGDIQNIAPSQETLRARTDVQGRAAEGGPSLMLLEELPTHTPRPAPPHRLSMP